MRSFAFVVLLAPFVSGCASWEAGHGAKWPWESNASLCKTDTCSANDAIAAFEAANRHCRAVHNYYEAGGRKTDFNQFAVGAVGTVAGTVVAPLASGNTAKALAGVAGATNAVQLLMEETFSASVAVRRRVAVADAASAAASTFYAETQDNAKRVALAVSMARECSLAPAKADQAALQAISK